MFQNATEIPPEVQALASEKYKNRRINILALPIWSAIRFAAAIVGTVFTVPTTAVTAFSYGVNGDMTPAGRAGVQATPADTSLQAAGQTRNNADVLIYGMSAFISPQSEPTLAAGLMREVSCVISTNGQTFLPLGRLEHFPQPGGLQGVGKSFLQAPDFANAGAADGGSGSPLPFFTNGNPLAGSFFRFEGGPLLWTPQSGNASDSTLSLICTPNRAVAVTSPAARPAAAGIAPFTPPTAGNPGTFVDVIWCLHSYQIEPASSNAG